MNVEDLIKRLQDIRDLVGPNCVVRFYLTSRPEEGGEGIMSYEIYDSTCAATNETAFILGCKFKKENM